MSGPHLSSWLDWMQSMMWQVAVLAALIVVAERLLHDRVSAQLRHGLWSLVVLKLLLPPSLPAWWRPEQVVSGDNHAVPPSASGLSSSSSVSLPATSRPEELGLLHTFELGPWLFGLWLCGAVVLGATTLLRRRNLRVQLFAASEPAPAALVMRAARVAERLQAAPRSIWRRMPAIRIGDVGGPLVLGCWRPVIFLPDHCIAGQRRKDGTDPWPDDDLDHALAHELAHVDRGDLWSEALFAALAIAYWFHPAIHIAQRRAHDLRELCCDATVASRLGPGYRRSLVRLAAQSLLPRAHAGAVPFIGSGSRIMARLEALERARVRTRRHRIGVLMIVGLSALIVLPMAPRVRARTADESLAAARALAERMATTRESDPAHTGSLHVRWAVMQLNQQESARQASGSKEK